MGKINCLNSCFRVKGSGFPLTIPAPPASLFPHTSQYYHCSLSPGFHDIHYSRSPVLFTHDPAAPHCIIRGGRINHRANGRNEAENTQWIGWQLGHQWRHTVPRRHLLHSSSFISLDLLSSSSQSPTSSSCPNPFSSPLFLLPPFFPFLSLPVPCPFPALALSPTTSVS